MKSPEFIVLKVLCCIAETWETESDQWKLRAQLMSAQEHNTSQGVTRFC